MVKLFKEGQLTGRSCFLTKYYISLQSCILAVFTLSLISYIVLATEH